MIKTTKPDMVPVPLGSARPESRLSSGSNHAHNTSAACTVSFKKQREQSRKEFLAELQGAGTTLTPRPEQLDRRLSDMSGTISLGSASSSEVASSYKKHVQPALSRSVNIRSRKVAKVVIPRSELHYDNAMDKFKHRVTSWLKKLGLKKRGPVPLPLRARQSEGDEEHLRARDPRRYKRRGKFVTMDDGTKAFEVWYELRVPLA